LLGAASASLIPVAPGPVSDWLQEHRIVPGHLFATDVVEIHGIGVTLEEKGDADYHDGKQKQQEQRFHESFSSSKGWEACFVSITLQSEIQAPLRVSRDPNH
jgi:hypothetical protein